MVHSRTSYSNATASSVVFLEPNLGSDLGRKDLLRAVLPQLERVLKGIPKLDDEPDDDFDILDAATWGPVLAVRALFDDDEIVDLAEPLPNFGELRGEQPAEQRTDADVREIISLSSDRRSSA